MKITLQLIMSFMTKLLGKISRERKNNFIPLYAAIAFSIILLIASCSKPAGLIGVVVQPDESKLKVGYSDTTSIYAYAVKEDSIRTDELTVNLLGSNMDPVFGNTVASFYMQFMLENADHDFGPNPVLDSLVLHLLYKDSYGDTNTMQTLHAYELKESISPDSVYYSNVDLPVGSTDFADFSFVPRPSDSTILSGDTLPPMLLVNLTASTELGQYLLDAPVEAMASNEAFQEYFNGLYVTADPVSDGGALLSFDLLSNYSEMVIYYSNDDQDSLQFDYMCTLLNATISKFTHDFESADFNLRNQVLNNDTALGATKFYLQGLGGVASVIKVPSIKSWNRLGPVAINEAKLVLTGAENDPLWGAPQQLSMAQIQDNGSFGYLVDQTDELAVYFGGDYDESTNSYTFRITRYIQSLIDNPDIKDNGLYLIPTGSSIYPNRFVFNGNEPLADTATRLKLEILYTELD